MKTARKIIVILSKVLHRIRQWPSKLIHVIYSIGLIKNRREHSRIDSIRSHVRNLSTLTREETFLARALKERGFCETNFTSLETFGSKKFQAAADSIYELMEKYYLETGKTINIVKLLDDNPSYLDQFKTVFLAGLDLKLLQVIEHYLKLPVAYGGVDIFFTIADGLEKGARTWHKDSEDNPMVKVAVYLNDVGDNGGPFEILRVQHAAPDFAKLRGFRQQKLEDLQNEGKIEFEIISFTGPLGTIILCDTFRYFHRGKPAIGQNRRALFFNYYASKPLTPYFCPNPPFSSRKMKQLVSGLSTTQKDAALWRENLTRIDKVVTKTKPYLNL